jgi:alcohol dehydrogenase (cytochrome c)
VTGEHLLTIPFTDSLNWSKGIDKLGRPIRDPEKDASPGGALVLPDTDGIVNWQPPTYDPQTGLFYVATDEVYSVYYRTEPNVRAR